MDKFYRLMIGVAFTFLLFSILVRAVHASDTKEVDSCDYTLKGELSMQQVRAISYLPRSSTLCINSAGGNMRIYMDLVSIIKENNIKTRCVGFCGSGAALAYLASDEHPNQTEATLGLHAPGYLDGGIRVSLNEPEHKEQYKGLGVDKLLTLEQWDAMWNNGQEIYVDIN